MSQEPKRRHSIARKGKRRASIKLTPVRSVLCANCQTPKLSHSICAKCGFYRGTQVIGKTSSKPGKTEIQANS